MKLLNWGMVTVVAMLMSSAAMAEDVRQPISLEAALTAAQHGNIDLISAQNAVAGASAGVRQARANPNPTLSLSAQSLKPRLIGHEPANQLTQNTVRIDQQIERGGKRRERIGAASANLTASRSDFADSARSVQAQVTASYFGLMAAERRVALYDQIAAAYRQSLVIAERRQANGLISGGDLARQRVESLRAVNDSIRAHDELRAAQVDLAVLIGKEATAATIATIGDWPTPMAITSESATDLADRRPDVKAAEARLMAARHQVAGAHALRHPDVSVGVQYDHDPYGPGSTMGFGISVPLQFRYNYGGEIEAANAGLREAEALAAKARAVAMADIESARAAALSAQTRAVQYDQELLPAARKAASTAEFAYDHGALALVDLLDARRTLLATELAAIDSHNEEAAAFARLSAATTTEKAE